MNQVDTPNTESIKYVETNYPEMSNHFKMVQRKQYELFCLKQMDYGPSNIAMGTTLSNPKEIKWSLTAILVRTNDKIQRLINLIYLNDREPKNESIIDSFMDISVYAIIALIVSSGKWGK